MQRPLGLLVPIGRVTTTRARLPEVVATVGDDLGLWQVCGGGDPGAGVGSVLPWTEHRVALLAQRFGPELYDKRLLGATRCFRYSLDFAHVYRGILPMNRVFFLTAALCLVRPTQARRVFQRGQEIQALPKDRCFLLQN